MKTEPMKHQGKGLSLLKQNDEFYGLGCEQGTGKTWMILAEAEEKARREEIDALVVIAPSGVHTNWTRREAPKHLEIEFDGLAWQSGFGVTVGRELERLLVPRKIRGDLILFSMNIEAVNTKDGFEYLTEFLRTYRSILAVDESTRIKGPKSISTQRMIELAPLAEVRRIASGTMMPNGPPDLFSQFEFLKPGAGLLGTTSFRAFVSEFADTLPSDHSTMRHLMMKKVGAEKMKQLGDDYRKLSPAMQKKIPQMEYFQHRLGKRWRPPQIIKKDIISGMPAWKNLPELQRRIKPFIYRVLKSECLDLPPKISQVYGFRLSKKQQAVYNEAEEKMRYERDNGIIDKFSALTKIIKLRQIVSNFIMLDDEPVELMSENPRLDLFKEIIEDVSTQFVVWAEFREEIAQIAAALQDMGITFVQYHGGVKKGKPREDAIDDFQAGRARGFLGHRKSGGTGLTLTAGVIVINYSHDYDWEKRAQGEDRTHRFGTKEKVEAAGLKGVHYIDLVAEMTLDERMISAYHFKEETASSVLNYID